VLADAGGNFPDCLPLLRDDHDHGLAVVDPQTRLLVHGFLLAIPENKTIDLGPWKNRRWTIDDGPWPMLV
jgi:hypothetical protein